MSPLYEFSCKECKKTFESIVPTGTKETICMCGDIALKIMSSPNFKINGFSEANGYSNKGSKKK